LLKETANVFEVYPIALVLDVDLVELEDTVLFLLFIAILGCELLFLVF
jgi:hypothetical protein